MANAEASDDAGRSRHLIRVCGRRNRKESGLRPRGARARDCSLRRGERTQDRQGVHGHSVRRSAVDEATAVGRGDRELRAKLNCPVVVARLDRTLARCPFAFPA